MSIEPIEPTNLTAQLHYRATGNPPSTLPEAAISNCFPGLEFDLRNIWRRVFEGIEVHEAHGLVTLAEQGFEQLADRELVQVDDARVLWAMSGPRGTDENALLGATFMEWSNALAEIMRTKVGELVTCRFAESPAEDEPRRPDPPIVATVQLQVRRLFAQSVQDEPLVVIDEDIAGPGELTQSLCSPWQNDYRECGCYYWAASRPDYVNVEFTAQGPSIGNNWMERERGPKQYEEDSATNARQLNYEELFRDWQGLLRFIVGGQDQP